MTKDQKRRAVAAIKTALFELYQVTQQGIDQGNLMGELETRITTPLDRLFAEAAKLETEAE